MFISCFAIGIFITVICFTIWILAKISTSLEGAHDVAPLLEEEVGGEVTPSLLPADVLAETAYWRVMAWAWEQSFQRLQLQGWEPADGDQAQECTLESEPEPGSLARGAAREAWAIHTRCSHCHG